MHTSWFQGVHTTRFLFPHVKLGEATVGQVHLGQLSGPALKTVPHGVA